MFSNIFRICFQNFSSLRLFVCSFVRSRKIEILSGNFSSRCCDRFGLKIVQVQATLTIFRSFEDFQFLAVSTGIGVNRDGRGEEKNVGGPGCGSPPDKPATRAGLRGHPSPKPASLRSSTPWPKPNKIENISKNLKQKRKQFISLLTFRGLV